MALLTTLGSSTAMGLTGILAAADTFWPALGQIGPALALGMAAFGSAVGIGIAGQAAAGGWAKEGKAGRNLSFTFIILLGMPISQTLYGMIVMNQMGEVLKHPELATANAGLLFGIGLATGLGEMLSAWMQGRTGAAGIRALSEGEGKGFAFLLIAMGIVETVGIFAMVFMLGMIPEIPAAG
jgi:V/A-type H+-transporting ATPase subunit K